MDDPGLLPNLKMKAAFPMKHGVVAVARQSFPDEIQIGHIGINAFDKMGKAAVAKGINGPRIFRFKNQRLCTVQKHKPSMKGPSPVGGVRKVVALFIKRTGSFNISGTTDTHKLTTGGGGVPHMFKHMAGIDKIKSVVFERQGFQGRHNQRTAMTLERFSPFRVVFREKIDKMGGILMRAMP